MDNHGYQATQSDGKYLKRVGSSYENFRNNPVIIQPYRLEKFNSTKDEILLQRLNLDLDAAELPDHSRTQSPSYARSTERDEGLWPNPYQTGI